MRFVPPWYIVLGNPLWRHIFVTFWFYFFGIPLEKHVLSLVHLFPSAPCPPAGLRVVPRTVVNDTQILRASWSTVNCPNSEYLLALTGSIQGNQALFDLASYWTSRTFFEVPLPCGSTYSATISARNSAATSDKSVAVTGTTGAQRSVTTVLSSYHT